MEAPIQMRTDGTVAASSVAAVTCDTDDNIGSERAMLQLAQLRSEQPLDVSGGGMLRIIAPV
jgi:hypothetical protein